MNVGTSELREAPAAPDAPAAPADAPAGGAAPAVPAGGAGGGGAGGAGATARALLESLRPRQWPKNAVVLVGLVFSLEVRQPPQVARAVAATLLFCLLSGAVYLLNDLLDADKDRRHPLKRARPIAAGRLAPPLAAGAAAAALAVGLGAALRLSPAFAAVALAYLAVQAAYLGGLKHVVLLDVMALAAGFVLRAVAGAVVVGVPISPWLYVCTMLLALFLALGKRRQELVLLAAGAAGHRPALEAYTLPLLDHLLQAVTTSLLVAYMLYTFFAETLPRTRAMMLTIPFVLYGLFRYLYLVHARGEGGSPEDVLLRDRPLAACILLWVAAVLAALYLAPPG